MTFDQQQLRRFAPFVLPFVIVGAGWMLLIRGTAVESARAGRDLEGLRQRLNSVRALMASPPPPAITADPVKAFERRVPSRDVSGAIVNELLRLARTTEVADPSVETGEPGVVTPTSGPQVAGAASSDPRFQLFATPLTYTPVTMGFDADYASLGEFLWRLRDLSTVVEVRRLSVARQAPAAEGAVARETGKVRVALALFAYARVPAPATVGTTGLASPKPVAEAGR